MKRELIATTLIVAVVAVMVASTVIATPVYAPSIVIINKSPNHVNIPIFQEAPPGFQHANPPGLHR